MVHPSLRHLIYFILLTLLTSIGCGQKTRPMNDMVEGIVKIDGTPLAQVSVEFIPDEGPKAISPSSSAVTDDSGHYSLISGSLKPGAVVGKHRVIVRQGRTEGRQDLDDLPAQPAKAAGGPRRHKIPDVYGIAAQTPLRVEVTQDQHTYDLQLSRNAVPLKE